MQPHDIHEDPSYELAFARAERSAWTAAAVLVGLATLGVMGGGHLSHRMARDAEATARAALIVEHERFLRDRAPSDLVVHIPAPPCGSAVATLVIDREYLDRIDLESVVPPPSSWTTREDGVALAFPVEGGAPVTVRLRVRPRLGPGTAEGTLSAPAPGWPKPLSVKLSHVVYP